MKYLLATMLLISSTTFGQSTEGYMLEGFWGLKFGESLSAVKAKGDKKAKKPGIIDGETLTYINVDFGGTSARVLYLYFFQDKLYSGIATFSPDTDPAVFSLYRSLKENVSEKWWRPQMEVEEYKYPFTDSKDDLTAVRGGFATILSAWMFPRSSRSPDNGIITLRISNKVEVVLAYTDGVISKKANAAKKSETSKDF